MSKSANLQHTGLKCTLLRIELPDKDTNLIIVKYYIYIHDIHLKNKQIEQNIRMNYFDFAKEMIHKTYCTDHSAVVLTYVFIYMRVWPCMTQFKRMLWHEE